MVFNVRCFKCGEQSVRLILGGRAIIHARCHACESNLLAEVMELQEEAEAVRHTKMDDAATLAESEPPTRPIAFSANDGSADEELQTGT